MGNKSPGQRTSEQVFNDWRYYLEFGGRSAADTPVAADGVGGIDIMVQRMMRLLQQIFARHVTIGDQEPLPVLEPAGPPAQSVKEILAKRPPLTPTPLFVNPGLAPQPVISNNYALVMGRAFGAGLLAAVILIVIWLVS